MEGVGLLCRLDCLALHKVCELIVNRSFQLSSDHCAKFVCQNAKPEQKQEIQKEETLYFALHQLTELGLFFKAFVLTGEVLVGGRVSTRS